MTVRTRIAPSPTGDPHVGTAYIALFNLAFARQHGGKFILRIEDTDQSRSTSESEQTILDSLRWLGLDWDEGPDVGGEYGPYRQSERRDIYAKYAQQLLDQGNAFRCYLTADELDVIRNSRREQGLPAAMHQSALTLSDQEVAKRQAAGAPFVVRMQIPTEGSCEFEDMLRGKIEIEWSMVDAQILLKSDGMPTYHLANVVDDHLMKITHVLRGEEWINSAPKHQLLYKYFNWNMPTLCHMPLLRNPDKSKLSKRKNPTSILYYKRMGYLPEGLLNYLGRMGWSMPDEREKFSRAEMFENFDIQRVSLGGPIFDQTKLSWLNGLWLRENLNTAEFAREYQKWALNPQYLMQIIPLIQQRVETFSDVAPLASFFLSGMLDLNEEDFKHKSLELAEIRKILQFTVWSLDTQTAWDKDSLYTLLKQLADTMQLKIRDLLSPLFIAIAGTSQSVSIMDSMSILGPDMSRARLRHALNILGSPSKKEAKRWDKEYKALQP
ncbi:MAG: glutamate--tRNA ligase [Pseudomonadales bacterium]|nr:glutamate--tRNA ligase [Pseudomonadales bacterium]NRA14413.1 glutamate--tRNA ligase [Oceanospirillaceae bacterium]